MIVSGMWLAFNFMQECSDLEENAVIRSVSLMSMDPKRAFFVDNVLFIRSLANGCSAAGEVAGPSHWILSPPATNLVLCVSALFGRMVQCCFPCAGAAPGGTWSWRMKWKEFLPVPSFSMPLTHRPNSLVQDWTHSSFVSPLIKSLHDSSFPVKGLATRLMNWCSSKAVLFGCWGWEVPPKSDW